MKKQLVLLYINFTFFTFHVFSQTNLVPNPSFEDTIACPSGPDEMYNSNGWSSYRDSPEYFNTCASSPAVDVPYNWGGYQQPASGNAYAAFATYASALPNYREYVGRQLLSSLNIGTKYYVSIKVGLSIGSSADANCASDKIGAMFSTVAYSVFNPAPITNNPPIYTDSTITDSMNWTRIFGSFICDSTYSYIIIGNFFDDNNTDTMKFYSTFSDAAYYYLDDVCVSTDSLFALNYDYTGITENNSNITFAIYPNPAQDYFFIENKKETYNLKIYDALGQKIYFKENINDKHFLVDLKNFNTGFLFINIISENYNYNYKLLKQ